MDKTVFVTYFNKHYLLKGLAMIESLLNHVPNAEIWVLAFDEYTIKILNKIHPKQVRVISPKEFEDRDLKKAKKNRSLVEFFWTCSPSLPLYVFKKKSSAEQVVYLDADLFFFSSPEAVIKNMKNKEILTVKHRYPRSQSNREKTSGIFNVGFQIFKRKPQAIKCLKRWRKQCLSWCYARYENGKMGDQLYLNEWPNLYDKLVISKNLGLNTAPWNVGQYKIALKKGDVYINSDKLICYHFHQLDILGPKKFDYVLGYKLSSSIKKYIYKPYSSALTKQYKTVKKIDPGFTLKIPKRNISEKIKHLIVKRLSPFFLWLHTQFFKVKKSSR